MGIEATPIDWGPEETREEYINRIAYNCYEMRMTYGLKGSKEEDWKYAEALVTSEEKRNLINSKE